MASKKQFVERDENILSILRYIRQNGPQNRRELCKHLNLSWGCVSELVSILVDTGSLIEKKCDTSFNGRTPSNLWLNCNKLFLGIDINAIGLTACICDFCGKIIKEFSQNVILENKEAFIKEVLDFTNQILRDNKQICAVGYAMQGIYNEKTALWDFSSEKDIKIDFYKDISSQISVPTLVEHDPNCMLYGCIDKCYEESKMLIRLDSGIGASIYKSNRFFEEGLLEIGYMVVGESGERLHKYFKRDLTKDQIKIAGKYLGIALGNLCNIISLDSIIICGEFINHYSTFEDEMLKSYLETVLETAKANISAEKINNAAYGAAKLMLDNYIERAR